MGDQGKNDPPSQFSADTVSTGSSGEVVQVPDKSSGYADLLPGEVILGKFKIIELIGQGGMGSVYRVDHLFLNRQFALKCLNRQQSDDASWRRFQNEAKAANKLDHPNLIKVYELDLLPDGRPFFLMDLVHGKTLSDAIKGYPFFEVNRVLKIMIQVAFAIQSAHQQGVIHRDLKPSNIMLVDQGDQSDGEDHVKVLDFGIAKLTGVDEFNQQTLTRTGEIFGSPLYMSPEQCRGSAVDHRSDLYSLGCVFYELLTGAPPFIGDNALNTMMKHQSDSHLSLKEASLGREFPPELERIIRKLLEKEPERRYQSANDLALDLMALLEKEKSAGPSALAPLFVKETPFVAGPSSTNTSSSGMALKYVGLSLTMLASYIAGWASCYLFINHSNSNTTKPFARESWMPDLTRSKRALNPKPAMPVVDIPRAYFSTVQADKRVFDFPAGARIGKICFGENFVTEARGRMETGASNPVGLYPSEYLLRNPQLFRKFRPDELSLIDFVDSPSANRECFKQLARFSHLKAVNLSKTTFAKDDIKYLNPLKELLCLNFAYCHELKGSDLVKLTGLNKLNCLDVSTMIAIKPFVRTLATMPNLRQVSVAGCGLSDEDMEVLSRNRGLKIVSIAWNAGITDTGIHHLARLKDLEWLDLSRTGITPACLESLKAMPKLRTVELGMLPWSDEQVERFEKELLAAHPHLLVSWKDLATHDPSVSMPSFKWNGPGLVCRPYLSWREVMKAVDQQLGQ